MQEITVKNQSKYIGIDSTKESLDTAGLILKDQQISKGTEFDVIAAPVTSDDKFLGFAEAEVFHTTASAEKKLGKKQALAKLNAQNRFNAMNRFRTLNGKSEEEKLQAIVKDLLKQERYAEAQAAIAKLEQVKLTSVKAVNA